MTVLSLDRFGPRQSVAMVERIAGGKALPGPVLDQIVAKADGVPLFLEELTKAVLESGVLENAADRWRLAGTLAPLAIPATLQDSLMARLDRLRRSSRSPRPRRRSAASSRMTSSPPCPGSTTRHWTMPCTSSRRQS